MLVFEFEGELFQLEAREPALAALSQLPPKIAAFLPMLPSAFLFHNPRPENFSNFGQ